MFAKGYSIEEATFNEILLNSTNEFGFDLKHKKEINILKDNIRHRNMTNIIKIKEKK